MLLIQKKAVILAEVIQTDITITRKFFDICKYISASGADVIYFTHWVQHLVGMLITLN